MEKSRQPKLCREARTIQESPGLDGELVIINLRRAVLGRAVGAGGFDGVVEVAEEKIAETGAPSKFATLIGADAAATGMAMLCQKCPDDVKRRLLAVRKIQPKREASSITRR